jgi:AcrR family transcriptional regulator
MPPPTRKKKSARQDGEPKRDTTRRLILERALRLFQKRGVERTTMRDIAGAAGLSLGAAYYHFASKEALLFAYYADNQGEVEARAATYPPGLPVGEHLRRLFHDKLDTIAPTRRMLGAIVQRLADPHDPVSAFSRETREVRERSQALFEGALAGAGLDPRTRRLAAQGLWLLQLGVMLYFVNDDSEGQARSHRLVDDLLELGTPVLGLMGTPLAQPLVEGLIATLGRAGLA